MEQTKDRLLVIKESDLEYILIHPHMGYKDITFPASEVFESARGYKPISSMDEQELRAFINEGTASNPLFKYSSYNDYENEKLK